MRPLIVLATDSREPSGLGEHMLTLGQAVSGQFEVVIACHEGAELLRKAAAAGLRIKAFDLEHLAAFKAWLRDRHAAILHVHAGIGWEGHELARAGKAVGLPVVRTEHLPYLLTSAVQQAEYGAMLQSVDRVIAVSRAVYDSVYARHTSQPMSLVQNGISPRTTSRDRQAVRAELGLTEHDNMLLTVGRFAPQKGYDTLLSAVSAVLERAPNTRFVWAGTGPDLDAMTAKVEQAGLQTSVTLLGHCSDVAGLLQAADVFVLPSLFEGLPLALLEAMAAGLPIVATAIGGTMEAIGDDHRYLARPGDVDGLADAIVAALDDPQSAIHAGVAGRARFERHFQAERMARQTTDIYAAMIAASPTEQVR